jgi:hypothetical protein
VSAAWVAGTVRSRALARRRVGAVGARSIAASPDLRQALASLSRSPYVHAVTPDQSLAEAQYGVAATFLWHVRVLAGWLPRDGVHVLRLIAALFEIANVDEHMRRLSELAVEPPYELGSMQTAWSRLRTASSLEELRGILVASPWGDPGAANPWAIHVGMRLAWADRARPDIPEANAWTSAAAALLLVREALVCRRPPAGRTAVIAGDVLGARFVTALQAGTSTIGHLKDLLPVEARWVLADIDDEQHLWRAEAAWWSRVEQDGFGLLRQPTFGVAPVLGAVAVLGVDAWRVRAALATAARAAQSPNLIGRRPATEDFDVIA